MYWMCVPALQTRPILYCHENELLAGADDPEAFYREVVMQDKLKINLEYVRNRSFWGDIKLIFNTIFKIL